MGGGGGLYREWSEGGRGNKLGEKEGSGGRGRSEMERVKNEMSGGGEREKGAENRRVWGGGS